MDCGSLNEFIRSIIPEEGRGARNVTGGMVSYLLSPKGYVIAQTNGQVSKNQRKPARLAQEEGGHLIVNEEGPEGGARFDGADGRRLLFWKTAEKSDWKIVLSIPEDLLDAPARNMAIRSASLGACGLVFMVAIASYLARLVTGPFPRLTAAAEAVESGDYRAEGLVEIAARRDEFGQLARGFRRMVAEVSAREDQLRQAQDDLIRRERHFRSLIENGSDVITVLDRDGTIRYESPSIRRVLGYDPKDLVGQARFDMVHPDDLPTVTDGMSRLVGGQNVDRPLEYRFRHKSGEWRTLEATGTSLLDDPAVGGIVINSRDVTERKLAEAELDALRRRHSDEMEQRVRLRTAELAQKNEELMAAKEATDQAMKQQEIFLSNVAHDLRTPLTIVIGFSEDLLRRARKKGQDAFIPDLNLIVNKGKDLLELINDLLNLSKAMNEKGVELDLKRFEVEPMIRSRMEGIGSIAQRQNNTIEFRPGPELGSMVADEAKVWRILMNLLTNSCKFTKGGSITLEAVREPGGSGDQDRLPRHRQRDGDEPGADGQALRPLRPGPRRERQDAGGRRARAVDLPALLSGHGRDARRRERDRPGDHLHRGDPRRGRVGAGQRLAAFAPTGQAPRRARPGRPGRPRSVDARRSGQPRPDHRRRRLDLRADAPEPRRGGVSDRERRHRRGGAPAGQAAPTVGDHPRRGHAGDRRLGRPGGVEDRLEDDRDPRHHGLDARREGARAPGGGADEYLSKPFSGGRLADLLRKHIGERSTARLLVVEDDADTRDRLARSLREEGWEVAEAGHADEALARLAESAPDVILLDLMLPGRDGLGVIADVRSNPAWESIPIIVVTAADLDAEARKKLPEARSRRSS